MKDFISSKYYNQIFRFHPKITDRIISRENSWLEFKESFNWMSKGKYAKSMIAFANNLGGFMVFGVSNQPRDLVGLKSNNFVEIDEAKIAEYLNGCFSPEVSFEKFTIEVGNKTIGIIHTEQSDNKPIVCVKNESEIKESDIYYRYNARSERIKYAELNTLLKQIREQERKLWMEHLEKISQIGPSNAAIMDVSAGEIKGHGGIVVIDKGLIPKLKFIKEGNFKEKGEPTLQLVGDVRPVSCVVYNKTPAKVSITDDPNVPVVRLEEKDIFEKFPLDYRTLTKELNERYINFKSNQEYHKIRKELKRNKNLCKTRYLDPRNPKSTTKDFYSKDIFKYFDKFYK